MSLLPEVREMTPLGGENQFHKFLRNAVFFHLTTRNPAVQVNLFLGIWTAMGALTGSAPMSTRPEGKNAWVMELIPALTAPGLLEEEAST